MSSSSDITVLSHTVKTLLKKSAVIHSFQLLTVLPQAKKALALLTELRPFMKVSMERTASKGEGVSGRQESEDGRGLVCAELLHSLILRSNTCAEI